jgi:hypothetical protein
MVEGMMWKWIGYAALVVGAGLFAFVAYDYYRAGFHTRPEMPEGAFSLSYKNGLRAIVVGVPDMRPQRKYLGVPYDVPHWYEHAWSFCSAQKPDEKKALSSQNLGPGSRLEAVCRIKVDETEILRGAIYSVPNL